MTKLIIVITIRLVLQFRRSISASHRKKYKHILANVRPAQLTHICNILNIKIKHGRPRHPQAQGQIERLNQTVGHGFTKLLWDDDNHLQRKDWISIIDAFTITYNSTIHRAHGRTPHEVMVGWKMHCVYGAPDKEVAEVDNDSNDNQMSVSDAIAEDVIKQRMSRVQQLRQSVNDSLDKYRSKLCRQGR